MFRILPWVMALLASLDLVIQSNEVGQSILAALNLRQRLFQDPWWTRREFCQVSPSSGPVLQLQWKEGNGWVDACLSSDDRVNSAPRYWRVEARPNFRLLFLGELPITMSIVILS